MADNKFHPALTVTNIKNLIPITLEMEKSQYSSWLSCLKFVVVHMSTISNDLLHTILAPDSTAQQAWDCLKSIFQDNKHSRALYLEQKFTNLRLDNFSNVSAYCQELKVLADQLSNVGSPVSNDRLVLQLVAGLNESYDSFASHLQHTDPLPQFYEARSRLILEETRKKKQAVTSATTVGSALLTTTSINNSKANQPGGSNHSRNTTGYGSFNNTNNTRRRGGGRNTNGRGHGGRGRGRGYNNNTNRSHYPGQQHQPWAPFGPWTWQHESWTTPPCHYPTSN
ncbi:retrovirus-related pol polyprotein from transposon TNT 1-94 [Tanacetum coccineum]